MRREIDTNSAVIRTSSAYLDGILGHAYPVLDHGFSRIVDYMGDDYAIKAAAQTSYRDGNNKLSKGLGVLNYLMRHWHTSPFEMCELKLHQQMPIFVARQWVRQRTASLNEFSGRYSIMPDLYYVPDLDRIQKQSMENKQGSGEPFDPEEADYIRNTIIMRSDEAFVDYKLMIDKGMAKELARIILPQNTYTQWYWKIDLHNLFNLLYQRLDHHAQWEVRQYAEAVWVHVQQWVPHAAKAFNLYRQHSQTFSARELTALSLLIDNDTAREQMAALHNLDVEGLAQSSEGTFSAGEWKEFLGKMDKLAALTIA